MRLLLRSKRVNDLRWRILSELIIEILFDSKYSSVVSFGMPFGISLSEFLEHLTTVPVHVHDGGQ
jgi:hypothetical protein